MFDVTTTGGTSDHLLDTLVERVLGAVESARSRAAGHDPYEAELGAAEIDVVAVCEEAVRIAQGVQADAVLALDSRRRRAMTTVDETTLTRSLFTEIALARQVSTPSGERTYAFAQALELHPQTHALLRDGTISSAVASAVCRETTYAAVDDRTRIDAEIASSLADLSPRRAAAEARRLVLAVDPHAAYERTLRAREDRVVTFSPELDAMASLTVVGPAEQLTAAFRRLDDEASARRADGDPRTIRQLMADLAIEAMTGARVDADGTSDLRTEIGVVMRPEVLFAADTAPASLTGYGPIPAELARRLATGEHSWVRRFFTTPNGDGLTGSDRRARRFSAAVRRLIRTVDGQCQRPWCDCRIRDLDHAVPYARGGPTTPQNAQGVCRPDNLAKEAPGWRVTPADPLVASDDDILAPVLGWRTPTGHTYANQRRTPLGVPRTGVPPSESPPSGLPESILERRLEQLLCA
ncbi:HNH endonuclease signature motif containing protein [Mumia sp. ZJ430]|uniref:HNH endonuclease n=1 Tax=Mumia sp. ZJ430 TaxID=2708083 RepID=UPI001422871A|nr:HNH endonuclease signature motif containing protein [Mumia sp. ZJ430]